jgi:hypothetical protein
VASPSASPTPSTASKTQFTCGHWLDNNEALAFAHEPKRGLLAPHFIPIPTAPGLSSASPNCPDHVHLIRHKPRP